MMFSQNSEPVSLERNTKAILVPQGDEVELPAGAVGYITQALGGSFTVYVDGNLFLIGGQDADALGKKPLSPPELPENAGPKEVEELVWRQLRTCYDPEIPYDIVELGLVYTCEVEEIAPDQRQVSIEMTLTAPGCGMGEVLVGDVASKVRLIPTIEAVDVQLVFDPPWNPQMMSEAAQLETGFF